MKPDSVFMCFDVESIGLHGTGFAVAYVVINLQGEVFKENTYSCDLIQCSGTLTDYEWVKVNIPALEITHPNSRSMRDQFWEDWIQWKNQGAILVADCPWPVEARFLEACTQDDPTNRESDGPYPLIDIASIQFAKGQDFFKEAERLPNELPRHHPLMDARLTARQLLELMKE